MPSRTTPTDLVSWPAPDATLWMHPDVYDPADPTAYPEAPGGAYTAERTYRDVLAQMNVSCLDPARRARALVEEWLMSQDFVRVRGGGRGVPAAEGVVWMPGGKPVALMCFGSSEHQGYLYTDPTRPDPSGIGLSYYRLSDDGRVVGWRWDDDAEAPARAAGATAWAMRPRLRPVVQATVAALAELLVRITGARFDALGDEREAETRAYQRRLIARMDAGTLRARLAEDGGADHVRAMWTEELARR